MDGEPATPAGAKVEIWKDSDTWTVSGIGKEDARSAGPGVVVG